MYRATSPGRLKLPELQRRHPRGCAVTVLLLSGTVVEFVVLLLLSCAEGSGATAVFRKQLDEDGTVATT